MADVNQELDTALNSAEQIDDLPDHIKRQLQPMIQEAVQGICTQVQDLDTEGQLRIARVLEAAVNTPGGTFSVEVDDLGGISPVDESQAEFEEFESFVMDD